MLDLGELYADVRHERIGAVVGLRVGELRDGEARTLTVEPDATLELVLLDRDTPLPQLMPTLQRPRSPVLSLYAPATGPSGHTLVGPLSSGEWIVDLVDVGVWPTRERVHVAPGDNVLEVQVRRLGGVALEVQTASGAAASGARVELHSLEFDTPVSGWIDAGRVAPPPGGLVTGEDGTLALSGLPNGRYAYRVERGGSVARGELVVPPAARADVRITLP